MGNHIAVEKEPLPLAVVLSGDDVNKANNNNYDNNHNDFKSSLHIWRFFPNLEDPQQIQTSPLVLNKSFSNFDINQVYLALHIFKEDSNPLCPSSSSSNGDLPINNNNNNNVVEAEVTVGTLLNASIEAFTPRGLANRLEEAFISSPRDSSNPSGFAYDMYIWHGKDSNKYTQAIALAKSFELEKALKNKSKLKQMLFYRGEKASLTSIFPLHCPRRSNVSDFEGDVRSSGIHLFEQLLHRACMGDPASQCTNASQMGANGIPKLSLQRVKNMFHQHPSQEDKKSPSNYTRSHSADSLFDLLNSPTSKDEPEEREDQASNATTIPSPNQNMANCISPTAQSGSGSFKKPRSPKAKSLPLPSSTVPGPSSPPPSHKKIAAKLKLPLLQTGAKPKPSLPIANFNLSDIQTMQDKERESDSMFNKAETKLKSEKLKQYDSICSKITDQLFLGSQTVSNDFATLKREGITHILNCAGSICPDYYPNDFIYRTLYLTDGVREDITCMFYDIIEWIENVIKAEGRLLIHCQQGVSRSSAMMIGYDLSLLLSLCAVCREI